MTKWYQAKCNAPMGKDGTCCCDYCQGYDDGYDEGLMIAWDEVQGLKKANDRKARATALEEAIAIFDELPEFASGEDYKQALRAAGKHSE